MFHNESLLLTEIECSSRSFSVFLVVSIQEFASDRFSRFAYAFCLLKLRICSNPTLQHGLALKCEEYVRGVFAIPKSSEKSDFPSKSYGQWRTHEFCSEGEGSTNSVEDRGQR